MRDIKGEFAAHPDHVLVVSYQATHGFKPGIDSWNIQWQEGQDSALAECATALAGGPGALERHDFSTPAGRLAAWEEVDYLNANPDEARQRRVADACATLGVTGITPEGVWLWIPGHPLNPYEGSLLAIPKQGNNLLW